MTHLAKGNGILRREAAEKHEDRNHDATAAGAGGGRERRAEENEDKQEDIAGTEVCPKSFVGAEFYPCIARALILSIAGLALQIGGTGTAFSALTNHVWGAAAAGYARLLRQQHLQHRSGISSTLKARIAVAA
jgi:hypothetical protein